MHEIYELKEMLCKELEEYGSKGELSAGSLEIIDKLAHTVKNLGKIIEMAEEEGEYSEEGGMYRNSYEGGQRYRNSYEGQGGGQGGRGGGSYARGRGRNARRDSRGRYSSEGGYSRAAEDMVMQLREMMEEAPDQKTRQEIQRLVTKLEQM